MAAENRVELMWNCSTTLEPNLHTHKLLKSYYMNMCRKFAKNTLQIPKEKFSTSQMCSHCGCIWSQSEFSMKLKPQQVAQNSKAKKLIEKLDKSKEAGQRGLLSRKQRRRAKWLQKRVNNYIEMKCEQCKHKSLIKMEKSKIKLKKEKTDDEPMELEVIKEGDITTTSSRKKKKKKNKSAGLKLPLPTDKQETLATRIDNKQRITQTVSNPLKSTAAVMKTNTQQTKSKKQKKSTLGIAPSNVSKVVSKTQHQNSLLQLAALLKQQTTATTGDGKSSAQKRLEALLK